jgi:tetratricopeptide (TPR) repeat protein
MAIFAGATCLAAGSANAAVTVIGSSAARTCYEAAESTAPPSRELLAQCDVALAEEGLSEPDTVATHVNRGILRARKADIEGAMADFDMALKLDPREPEAYLNKGLVLTLRANDAAQGLPMLSKALEMKTRRPALAHYGRGIAFEDLGEIRKAYSEYSKAAQAAPKWRLPRAELTRFSIK